MAQMIRIEKLCLIAVINMVNYIVDFYTNNFWTYLADDGRKASQTHTGVENGQIFLNI
jgi:hypothetical protein